MHYYVDTFVFLHSVSWTAEFETLKIRNLSICKIFKFGLL